jgi:hypothetical protein
MHDGMRQTTRSGLRERNPWKASQTSPTSTRRGSTNSMRRCQGHEGPCPSSDDREGHRGAVMGQHQDCTFDYGLLARQAHSPDQGLVDSIVDRYREKLVSLVARFPRSSQSPHCRVDFTFDCNFHFPVFDCHFHSHFNTTSKSNSCPSFLCSSFFRVYCEPGSSFSTIHRPSHIRI